ncbi:MULTISPECIES: ABC transporter substrate-binding protein [unclassified Microcoleus]|uniref:ABC transporter substrate-binding protein n=1 Tax=unclassified Microcoleus TaxID=2642155 RepID=UPI002FCF5279
MADDPNGPWECTGNPPGSHTKIENYGDTCLLCSKHRPGLKPPNGKGGIEGIPWRAIAAAVVLAVLGIAVWLWISKPRPKPEEVVQSASPTTSPTASPTTTPPPVSLPASAPERYSNGERRLFLGKPNADGDRGTQAFKASNYSQASEFFEKAAQGDRNSPELQIYFNNAKARLAASPFALAVVVPVEGGTASAEEMLRGVADAQTKFNDAGGLDKRLLEIFIANDGNDPPISAGVAQELAKNSNILGVIGHNASDASKAALVEYEKAGIPMVSPTSTSTTLSGSNFFRTVPSDAVSGRKLADYAWNTLRIDKVAIFYNPKSTYSSSLQQAFEANFKQPGGIVVRSIDMSNPAFKPQDEIKALQGQVNAIVLLPNTQFTTVAIALAVANSQLPAGQQMKLLGGDALYTSTTLTSGGNAVEGLILAVPWFAQTPYAQTAEKRWLGQVSWRTATSFDATQALIKALSSSPSRSTVLQNLKSINISPAETSGSVLMFEQTGDRLGEPILVQTTKGSGGPSGTPFTFKPIQ